MKKMAFVVSTFLGIFLLEKSGAAELSLSTGALVIENLGSPIQSTTQEHQIMFRSADNDLHLLLYYDFHDGGSPLQILDTNLTKNSIRLTDGSPGRPGPNATLYYPPNDKIYIGNYHLQEYDPKTGEAKKIATFRKNPTGSISSAQISEIGDDGFIYIGKCCSGGVERYYPIMNTYEDLGNMDPDPPALQYAYSLGSDGQYLYVGLGQNPWYLAIYEIQTKKITYHWKGAGDDGQFVLHGKTGGLYYQRVLSTGGTKWYRLQNGTPTEILSSEVPPTYSIWEDRGNVVKGTAGFPGKFGVEVNLDKAYPNSGNGNQASVLWRNVGGATWQSATMNNFAIKPITIKRMIPWDNTHFLSIADFYGPVFLYDTISRKTTTLGYPQYSLYDALWNPGHQKIFLSGYPTSTLVYDPTKPWTLAGSTANQFDPAVNPYKSSLQLGKYHYYSVMGSDGLLYVASQHARDSTGGELGWFDSLTGKSGHLREPFMNTDPCDLIGVLGGEKLVYVDDSGTLFVFDITSKTIEKSFTPVPGLNMKVNIFETAEPGVIFGVTDTQYFKANIQSGLVSYVKNLGGTSFPEIQRQDRRLIKGPDGFAWLFIDNVLTRINPADGEIQKLLTTPAVNLVFNNRDLYLYDTKIYGSTDLKRIKNILTEVSSVAPPLPSAEHESTPNSRPAPILNPVRGEKIVVGQFLNGDTGTIEILSRTGELVRTFPEASTLTEWDGRNQKGDVVSSGVYLVKFPKGQKKIVVVK